MKIIVIGGGAAGFFGAISAAKNNPQAEVTLLEASQQPLAKVRISGGGRCNVTHACFESKELIQHYPRGAKALLGAFSRFQPQDTVTWFAERGVPLKTEADGRMFPITDDSETIVNCLLKTAKSTGVEVIKGAVVIGVKLIGEDPSQFQVMLKSGEKLKCDRILLATGSNPVGYRIAQELGHQITQPVPSLFTFNVPDEKLRELAGVSINPANLRLTIPGYPQLEQTGALLITHWGLSGPAVLKLSAWAARMLYEKHYQGTLTVNLTPHLTQEEVRQKLLTAKVDFPRKAIALHRGMDLPHRLWQYLVFRAGVTLETRWAELSSKVLNKLVQDINQGQYLIHGKGVFKDEFVTCGGVNLKEVNFKTMESRVTPGLYFAGEVLDIDGVTGGFNFQSAWTTSYLAGSAISMVVAANVVKPTQTIDS
jgi:predicted Rossmann fold flavoprotein